jgi:hypothetical protein
MFAEFAHFNADAVLSGWRGKTSLPHGLRHDDGFDRCQVEATELRELYLDWCPTSEQVEKIVTALAIGSGDPLGDVVLKLILDLPLLMGHIMRHWLNTKGTPEGYNRPRYLTVLRAQLKPQLAGGNGAAWTINDLLGRAAESMRSDPKSPADDYFVKHAIADPAIATLRREPLLPAERRNLAVALQVAPFRQYLALRVLDEIEQAPEVI